MPFIYRRLRFDDFAISNQESASRKINKIIDKNDFLKSNDLTESQLAEIFILFKVGLGNRQMRRSLYDDNKLEVFNDKLRYLLNEKEPLPKRFDNFVELKKVGLWTTSQFLSVWKPSKYPFVATSGRIGFMDKVLLNQLDDSQLKLAKEDALSNYKIKENEHNWMTVAYLTYQQIFNEIRELCRYDSYLEVQNLLWIAHLQDNKLEQNNGKTKELNRRPYPKTQDNKYGKNDSSKTSPPERIFRHIQVWKRNQEYVSDLKSRYLGKCQFTDCSVRTFAKRNGTPYSEAHHPKPLGEKGADELGNLIILCPTHHKMFHYADTQIRESGENQVIAIINGKTEAMEFEQNHFQYFKRFYQAYMKNQ